MKKLTNKSIAGFYNVMAISCTLVLFCSTELYAQQPRDLGEGTFTLQYYHYESGSFSSDSSANILLKRVYFVNHFKVLVRTIGPSKKLNKPDTSKITTKVGDLEIKSQMSAKALYPVYLADYKKNNYTMYFEKSKKQYFFPDSLKNHPENLYKPRIIQGQKKPLIIVHENEMHTIAGKRCLRAEMVSEGGTSTIYFTREKLKFVSPLNIPGVDGSVLGLYAKQKGGHMMGIFLIDIKDEQLPDHLFTIESTAQPKTKNEVFSSGS